MRFAARELRGDQLTSRDVAAGRMLACQRNRGDQDLDRAQDGANYCDCDHEQNTNTKILQTQRSSASSLMKMLFADSIEGLICGDCIEVVR